MPILLRAKLFLRIPQMRTLAQTRRTARLFAAGFFEKRLAAQLRALEFSELRILSDE